MTDVPTGGRLSLAVLVLVVCLAGCVGVGPGPTDGDGTAGVNATVTVVSVTDGDILDVRFPDGSVETVRLLGVDTPETYAESDPAEYEGVPNTAVGRRCLEAAGENATRFVEEALAGATVRVRTDPTADWRGGYDRLLVYVVADDRSLNRALLARGHARLYDSSFADRDAYAALEREAMAADRGLWACAT